MSLTKIKLERMWLFGRLRKCVFCRKRGPEIKVIAKFVTFSGVTRNEKYHMHRGCTRKMWRNLSKEANEAQTLYLIASDELHMKV